MFKQPIYLIIIVAVVGLLTVAIFYPLPADGAEFENASENITTPHEPGLMPMFEIFISLAGIIFVFGVLINVKNKLLGGK